MTMEVLAAEFPDIFQHFIEIVPDPNKPDQHIYVNEEDSNPSNSWKSGNINDIVSSENVVFSSETEPEEDSPKLASLSIPEASTENSPEYRPTATSSSDSVIDVRSRNILMEHDYDGQNIVAKDSNRNTTKYFSPVPRSINNTKVSNVIKNNVDVVQVSSSGVKSDSVHISKDVPDSVQLDKVSKEFAAFEDIDEILQDLSMITHDYNSNIQMLLDTEKSGFGCSWSASKGSICAHGNSCPFTTKILELDQIPHSTISDQVSKPPQRLHNVVVLKQTPHGLVKVPDSMIPQHQLDKFRGLHNPRPQDNSSAGPYIR